MADRMSAFVLLVNANRIRPPVAPVAIDYLASALEDRRVPVRVLDLAWSADIESDIASALSERPALVGLTGRCSARSAAPTRSTTSVAPATRAAKRGSP
jgi:hypothetical protein